MSRTRKIVAAAAVCVVVAAAVAVVTYALRYQPIRVYPVGGITVFDKNGDFLRAAVETKEGWAFPGESMVTITEAGSVIHLLVSLRNDGPFPVEVDELETPWGHHVKRVGTLMGDAHAGGADRPFHPIALNPGDIRSFQILIRPDDCILTADPDMFSTLKVHVVEFAFLGVSHRVELPVPAGYTIRGLPDCSPAR